MGSEHGMTGDDARAQAVAEWRADLEGFDDVPDEVIAGMVQMRAFGIACSELGRAIVDAWRQVIGRGRG